MAVIGFAALAFGIFVLDMLLKNHVEKSLQEGDEKPFCGGRLLIRKYHNKGAFLDMGEGRPGAGVHAVSRIDAVYDGDFSRHVQLSGELYP